MKGFGLNLNHKSCSPVEFKQNRKQPDQRPINEIYLFDVWKLLICSIT